MCIRDRWYSDFTNPDGTHLISQTYDKELWKKAMDAAEDAIAQGEADGFKLFESSDKGENELERGYNNYRAAFIGNDGSSQFYNNEEHLFSYNNQGNISYNAKNMAPRVGYSSYSADGFRGYFVPTLAAAQIYLSKDGLPMDVDPDTKNLDLYKLDDEGETVLLLSLIHI